MNGYLLPILLGILQLLTGLVLALVGVVVREHEKTDGEHRERMDGELKLLRSRLHDIAGKLAALEAIELMRRKGH